MVEVDGKVTAALDIAEHQQRDEHHPGDNQCQEEARLLRGLRERDRRMDSGETKADDIRERKQYKNICKLRNKDFLMFIRYKLN